MEDEMSLLGDLMGVVVDVVKLPVAVVKDVVTLGGAATDHDGTYTGEQLEELEEDLREL